MKSTTLKPLEMTRSRDPGSNLLWLVHVFFSKQSPALRDDGWSPSDIIAAGKKAWKYCTQFSVISYGGTGGSALAPETLRRESDSDRRQLIAFTNILPGDVVVATLGNKILGWGRAFASEGHVYAYRPASARKARKDQLFRNWWFYHVVNVKWSKVFNPPINAPSQLPYQPTVRWPKLGNSEAWAWLRSQGVPMEGLEAPALDGSADDSEE